MGVSSDAKLNFSCLLAHKLSMCKFNELKGSKKLTGTPELGIKPLDYWYQELFFHDGTAASYIQPPILPYQNRGLTYELRIIPKSKLGRLKRVTVSPISVISTLTLEVKWLIPVM